ncbi:hypothetical protein [Maritimibacter alkaliphilus]|jgi:hypothetical protein|uniref:hypothetical protein n=1 Tax=Maritimibacter alkaliphilus TaxID=404236 RepID=UPI001C952813|nr:hypothetical protein [Maritimibacter alkaliphilus]MBY6092907.1 hypothetical protein [Maritimibacter alkaliphilus]
MDQDQLAPGAPAAPDPVPDLAPDLAADLAQALSAKLEEARLLAFDGLAEIETLLTVLCDTTRPEDTGRAALKALEARHVLRRTLVEHLYHAPSAQVSGLAAQAAALAADPLFDPAWYRASYPDVAAAGLDPAMHYLRAGAFEGRDPGPAFQTMAYYSANPDIARAGWPALSHYLMYGRAAGRATGVSPERP